MQRRFSVSVEVTVDEDSGVLSTTPHRYTEDVEDLFEQLVFDIDGVVMLSVKAKEK